MSRRNESSSVLIHIFVDLLKRDMKSTHWCIKKNFAHSWPNMSRTVFKFKIVTEKQSFCKLSTELNLQPVYITAQYPIYYPCILSKLLFRPASDPNMPTISSSTVSGVINFKKQILLWSPYHASCRDSSYPDWDTCTWGRLTNLVQKSNKPSFLCLQLNMPLLFWIEKRVSTFKCM